MAGSGEENMMAEASPSQAVQSVRGSQCQQSSILDAEISPEIQIKTCHV